MKPLATRAARSLSGQRHSDEAARTPAPQLQRWRVDFPGAGRFVRAGPPTEVGVFAGGSLAGKDSSSSSSSFSSASARDLRGGVFRGSFIRRLRGGLRKRAQPLGVNQAVKRPHHIGRRPQRRGPSAATSENPPPIYGLDASVQFCAQLKLFKRLTSFFCNFQKDSRTTHSTSRRVPFSSANRAFQALAAPFASGPPSRHASGLADGSYAVIPRVPSLHTAILLSATLKNKYRTELPN